MIDPKLYEIATASERIKLDALALHGSGRAASKALGLNKDAVGEALNRLKNRASRLGIAPGHFEYGVAPGYLMGKVTVQRAADGAVERTWERQSPDQVQWAETLKASVLAAVEDTKGTLPATLAPTHFDADLLTVIPIGDPHFGLLTWAKEVGDSFDLKIAETLTFDAVDQLCQMTPASETAMLLNLGDYFHADNSSNRTPRSGATLDVDGRFPLIAQVGFRALVRCVRRLLEKHARVIVRNNAGNHDPHMASMLSIAMDAMFADEPRVHVEMTPAACYYYRFGKTLIGSTHGDGPKLADLPLIMATDVPQDWAQAKWRVWHCGHFHHDQLKDHPGCTVETHRTLAANDAWHKYHGYRSGRDMKAVIYHREHGEISRIRCGLSMLGRAA